MYYSTNAICKRFVLKIVDPLRALKICAYVREGINTLATFRGVDITRAIKRRSVQFEACLGAGEESGLVPLQSSPTGLAVDGGGGLTVTVIDLLAPCCAHWNVL